MKAKFINYLIIVLFITYSCNNSDNALNNDNKDYPCNINMDNYDYSYGIEYNNPQLYLTPGTQSDLNDEYIEEIRINIGTPDLNISGILTVSDWFNSNFTFDNAGGSMIGKKTVNELYETMTFYGCHSAALVLSSVLRKFGFPTVMIETASVEWAYDYFNGKTQGFAGHVMSEVYVLERWILLDNNGTFVVNYDCLNPFISTISGDDLFSYAKGKDIWDYGVQEPSDTHDMMISFSNNVGCFEDKFNSIIYYWED